MVFWAQYYEILQNLDILWKCRADKCVFFLGAQNYYRSACTPSATASIAIPILHPQTLWSLAGGWDVAVAEAPHLEFTGILMSRSTNHLHCLLFVHNSNT